MTETSWMNGLGVSTDIDAECFLELKCKLGTFVAARNLLRFGEEIATDTTASVGFVDADPWAP